MMPLTYVELFAGAGGLSRGLEMAGWACVAHAEWDAYARAVLRRHWPDTPLFGDVSTLTGQMIYDASGGRPVTMLTGGSPCQDLSIAGKRAGMTEDSGTRSSLYFEQVRLWHELNAISPCPYLLWENVLGAFSSNHGKDFAAVLSALVGTPVAVPEDGWKGGGGVVSGCAGVAAWRVLDCQYFGPPQRRRRVFVLGVRAGAVDPAEVLSLAEGLSGHLESCDPSAENAPPDAGSGVAGGGAAAFDPVNVTSRTNRTRVEPGLPSPTLHSQGMSVIPDGALTPWDYQAKRIYATTGVMPSLQAADNSGQQQTAVFPVAGGDGIFSIELANQGSGGNRGYGLPGEPIRTLSCESAPGVVAFAQNASGELRVGEIAKALGTNSNASGRSTPMVFGVISEPTVGQAVASVFDARGNGTGSVVSTLPGDHLNRITDYTPVVIPILEANARQGLSKEGSVGIGKDGDPMFTLQATVQNGVFVIDKHSGQPELGTVAPTADDDALAVNVSNGAASVDNVMGTLGARSGGSEVGAQTRGVVMASLVRPRRLMPIECERLMGWPDRWTERGVITRSEIEEGIALAKAAMARPQDVRETAEDYTLRVKEAKAERARWRKHLKAIKDAPTLEYALSDSARYKLCGNGVASPVAGWIGWRLRDTLEAS